MVSSVAAYAMRKCVFLSEKTEPGITSRLFLMASATSWMPHRCPHYVMDIAVPEDHPPFYQLSQQPAGSGVEMRLFDAFVSALELLFVVCPEAGNVDAPPLNTFGISHGSWPSGRRSPAMQ